MCYIHNICIYSYIYVNIHVYICTYTDKFTYDISVYTIYTFDKMFIMKNDIQYMKENISKDKG